jgi:hypothetical protein
MRLIHFICGTIIQILQNHSLFVFTSAKEMLCIYVIRRFCYNFHKDLLLNILFPLNPVHMLMPYFCKFHSKTLPRFTPNLSSAFFP